MLQENLIYAFLLTLFAGLSTGIGSLLAIISKRTNTRFLSFSLGLSAGVMIYVSFVDIFPKSTELFAQSYSSKLSNLYTVLSFFGGIALIALIDKIVPSAENPHEMVNISTLTEAQTRLHRRPQQRSMMRMGVMTALVIGIHNFPEGLATFMAALEDPQIGIAIASAIAIHNIPEGIAVAIPIYIATSSRKKAFGYSFLSGLAEPIGAVVGYLLLMPFMGDTVLGVIFGGVAGVMVYISMDELLPAAREWGEHHISIWGLIVGMAIMACGLLVFA